MLNKKHVLTPHKIQLKYKKTIKACSDNKVL